MSYAARAQGLKPAFYVSKSWHKLFAGPQGDNIKKAQQTYHVKIVVPPRESKECGIAIDGKPEDIEKTKIFFEEILGFQVGKDPLVTQHVQLTVEEVPKISSNKQFMVIVKKHGASVLFPSKEKHGDTIIQGRTSDIEEVVKEFSKIVSRQLDILDESKLEEEKSQNANDLKVTKNNKMTTAVHMDEEINEVLFFHPFEEDDDQDFETFLEYLISAQHSIDICVFTITDDRIKYVLEREKKSGTKVRVITDNSQALTLGSDAKWLHDTAGIPVKVDYDVNEESHMHHKFCIIDDKIAMTGSFNWTRSASAKNYENILITNNKSVVKQYKNYFLKLWNEDKSIVDLNTFLISKSSEVSHRN